MTTIRNVAIAGASGMLGTPVLNALVNSKAFNVTVLSRKSSNATFPESVSIAQVDYTSITDLTNALKGQDAVVSVLPTGTLDKQVPLIEASVAAGVKRFIPSDFGSDNEHSKAATLPVYQPNIAVHKVLNEQTEAHPEFTYTVVNNGVFLDWSLLHKLILDFDSETPALFDGGDRPFSTSTLASVGKAVVGVLKHPEETRNRTVFVHDLVLTQNKVLAIARKLAPEKTWNPVVVHTTDLEKQARENYAKGSVDMYSSMGFYMRAAFGDGYGGEFKRVDNEAIGTAFKTDADLEALVKRALDRTLILGSQ